MSSAAHQAMPFIAASAEEAVAQIRARLGSEAVVLNVRPLKTPGLARFWQKPMIEVMAYRPEPTAPPAPPAPAAAPINEALAGFRQELEEIKQQVDLNNSGWRVATLLQKTGLLPLHTQQILDALKSAHGDHPPSSLAEEIALARAQLASNWRAPYDIGPHSMHVLIGPAGSGKSTLLCKWLTQAALVDGRQARVWRLDGATSNTAEFLSVHGEALSVAVERCWTPDGRAFSEDIGFMDLPGVDWRSSLAIRELAGQLTRMGSPHMHLVLNGAYDIKVLLAQVRAFSALPLEDLIISHLDEEPHWGKLWNLTLGAGLPIRHLSAGQNIPGEFWEASAERILARQFPRSPLNER
jgi:flagellar biosynthesis protein FlhF